eukprot:7434378-Ditylum_brightwellii.AAC.1
MIVWHPKTSKLGGLPNITFEMHAPIELGSMLKNSLECINGIFNSGTIPSHMFKFICQVEGSNLPEDGWVGGDTWFGSITMVAEVQSKFKFESTWIIKNNTLLYPMDALYNILNKACHKKKCLGHWIVMSATTTGVDVLLVFTHGARALFHASSPQEMNTARNYNTSSI